MSSMVVAVLASVITLVGVALDLYRYIRRWHK